MGEVKTHNRGKKFLKDFGIYAIGNLGSKLITFLMIPLYTYFVEKPSDYGYFDLCLQLCMLLTPVITLQLRDGAFRFLLETQDNEKRIKIISFVYSTLGISILSTIAIGLTIALFTHIAYLWSTIALLVVMAIYEVLAHVMRGLGNNKAFIAFGLIASFGIGLLSFIFVAWLKMGILGIFLANIIARIIAVAIVEFKMKTFSKYFNLRIDYKDISKLMLKYSLPLIPVTLCWWLTTTSDRFFIKYFLGLELTGLYAVAIRFGSFIHTFSNIFFQTWQENAIQQYNSPDRDAFFSKIFNYYIYILSFILIAFTFFIKICFGWIVGPNYQSSFEYVYLVNLSTIIFAIAAYFELPYQCAKDTKRAIPSIILTAIVNVVLNLILIPIIQVYGVIITAILSYLFLTVYRWIDTRKYFTLVFQTRTVIPIILIVISALPFYLNNSHFVDALYIALSSFILFITIPKSLREELYKRIKRK